MSKPSWKQVLHRDTLKFFTGWQGDIGAHWRGNTAEEIDAEHETQYLEVKLDGIGRGRSAANFYLIDAEGHRYMMGMKGGYTMIERLLEGKAEYSDGWIYAEFKQTKQGQSYFIEMV